MSSWKRLLFYLILNVLVSAGTTFGVLTWWDRSHRAELPVGSSAPAVQPAQAQNSANPAAPTLPPTNIPVIEIKNVFGVGDIQNEVVLIQRVGKGQLSLAKWKIQDESGKTYTFPDLLLNEDGAVQVYTRAGTDTVIELYWGQKQALWKSGEQVVLIDSQGALRATYTIP